MLDLRVLNYFLTVARTESITRAAEALHLSQPTLSRQLREMEEALGKQLMIRGARRITLTEDGVLLRSRAEEILTLAQRTENELTTDTEEITGDIHIGSGEAASVRFITRTVHELQTRHPGIRLHIRSGDARPMLELLDKGLITFAAVYGAVDSAKYETLPCPEEDHWGVLLRRDHPLAAKESITPEDLRTVPLILSMQTIEANSHADALMRWLGAPIVNLNVVATYNLAYNASLMVMDSIGVCISLRGIINVTGDSPFTFRPLSPPLADRLYIVWKRYPVFSRAARTFLEELRAMAHD